MAAWVMARAWINAGGLLLALAWLTLAQPAHAQIEGVPGSTADPPNAILVLNQERLLAETLYGQRLQRELEEATVALATENRQIEAELTQEELDLTELRPTLEPDQFRVLADAFDARVTAIRAAQDAKTRDLQIQADAARQQFFQRSVPILLDVIEARGAAVLLDSRTVLLSAEGVDVTTEAITAIDAAVGNGGLDPIIELPEIPVPEPE